MMSPVGQEEEKDAILGRKATHFPRQIEATKDEKETREKPHFIYRQNKLNKAGN